jgi:acyl-CoA reductase-like NAD-dependent aldehyde dehydrogenase
MSRDLTAGERATIRHDLTEQLPTLRHLLAQAETDLGGPDPESALVYVDELREECDSILRKLHRRPKRQRRAA